ncbi:putative membrane protein [Parelusimicrobium proximum]|uniref:Bax inhibitor-1/YccA family protein n=1 Tax=Parelusimicrobium proximum TaxID=3228953 RepID=UPI003D182873
MTSPVFNEDRFREQSERADIGRAGEMTMQGTINKSFTMLFVLLLSGMFAWANPQTANMLFYPALFLGFGAAIFLTFKPFTNAFVYLLYAAFEGVVLGAVSFQFNAQYAGIVAQAVMVTLAVFVTMLAIYKFRIIKVTSGFAKVVVFATAGICVFYLIGLVMALFGRPMSMIYSSSPLSIGISVFVCIIAALNFMLDFNFIERSVQMRAPKQMEWYGAFGLMVTIVWLYIEVLRLLGKARNN